MSSPTRYKVGNPADKSPYYVNGISKPSEVILKNLVLSGSSNSGSRQVPYTVSEQTRYYAQLSPLSIPSVPEATGIYDKESDYDNSEGDVDDEQAQSPFSPILPRHAFAQVAKGKMGETQPAISTHKSPTDNTQICETPRGRTRSRSVGRSRTKLVKSRKVAV